MDLYATAKAIHIVGFISWFAGLFYLVRLFIYHAEAADRPEAERQILQPQYQLMQARLWSIITRPAMIATVLAGGYMVSQQVSIASWLWIKFGFLAALIGYHASCGAILRKQAAGTSGWSPRHLRMYNEVATLLMVAIVFLAVFRNAMSAVWGMVGLLALGLSLMFGIRFYRRVRSDELPKAPPSRTTPPERPSSPA